MAWLAAENEHLDVLVVEDDQQMARTLSDILRHRGYLPATAATGTAALERLAHGSPPAIALVDLVLPDMAGLEVVKALRLLSRSTQVVVLTGHASFDSALSALREETYDYLIKPIAPDALLQTIDRAGERWRRLLADDLFAALLEAAPDAMVIADQSGRIVLVNGQMEKLFGYTRAEILGKSIDILVPAAVDARHQNHPAGFMQDPRPRMMGSGMPLRALRKDGTSFPVEISLGPIQTANGMLISSAVRDISGRVQLEEQLRQSQKMEAIGLLASGVSHDFNNLLTVILSYSVLASQALGDHPAAHHIEEIFKAGQRATLLTQQLLAFSRSQVMQPKVIDLNRVVVDVEGMLQRLIGEDISLELALESRLPRILADQGQIEQVLLNLAVNGRDAMPDGGRLVLGTEDRELDEHYLEQHPDARAGSYILLTVSDTGYGMDAAVRSRIFEPFFTTKEAGRGTGLGLSTAYGIVRQSGGHIEVYSEPGHGTTFKIYFPRVLEEVVERPLVEDPEAPPPRGDETVLLIEDEPALRVLIRTVLASVGYTVLDPETPAAALAALDAYVGPIHLLLTDVILPGISGPDIAARVAAARPDTRVVYMSGHAAGIVDRKRMGEAAQFIGKPFSVNALLRMVRSTLDAAAPATKS